MKLRSVALLGVASLAVLGLIGSGAHAVFTTSTTSSQTITAGTFGHPPTVTITYPVNNTTYGSNWTGTITGTASSNSGAGTSISAVSVAIEDTTTGLWWNGINFGSGETFNVASGTTSWTFPLGAGSLTSGVTYKVIAKATDSLGFVATSSTVSFTYNIALPTVTITYPVNNTTYGTNWGGAITGTASANAAGASITKVKVSIQQVGGSCWTGLGDTYTASCPNYVAVTTGTTSWSLTLSASDLTSGDSYKVTAQATDSYGNTGTSSTVTFTYVSAAPTVIITYPVNGSNICACSWGGAIKGTASSNAGAGTSITNVSVAIENTTTGKWWNGSSFASGSEDFVAASGTTSWTFALKGSSLTTGDAYSVIAEATDSLGNVGTSSTVSFTYCRESPPTVTITYPLNNTAYGTNWTGTIKGTASSNAGTGTTISAVSVAIENTTTTKWWNGTSFSATSQTFVAAGGTTSWSLPLAAKCLTSGDAYSVIAKATDSLGNTGTSSTVSFTYNSSPPTVTITYPVNKTTYGTSWTGTITGTASSNAGSGTTITSVAVAIENTTTGKWWNGSGFLATKQDFLSASGTTNWTLSLAAKYLASGDSYSVISEATDSLGNVGTSSTVNFTYNSGSHG